MSATFQGTSRYTLIRPLGEGGMGAVYLVEDTATGRQVALKVLLGKGRLGERQLLQFKQEYRAQARLKHPHTCEVYDFGQLPDGTPYFTMAHVPGESLEAMLPLAPDRAVAVLAQVLKALSYIHRQGYVHGDLKPENIRVSPEGDATLMDFGLMEAAGHAPEAIKGTLAYIAPEAAKCDRVDQRSDLYALGAVAYELLSGQPPFKGESAVELLKAHLNQAPRPLSEVAGDVPAPLAAAVGKLLAKEPTARFQSAEDVLAALGLPHDAAREAALLTSAFVGRRPELDKLMAALNGLLRDRTGGARWITGPAGAGKSRLLGELRFAAQLQELPFLVGHCPEQPVPYGAFLPILRGVLPIASERCSDLLAQHAPLLAKLLPELADGRPAPDVEPDTEKIMIQAALTALVLQATAETGAVIAIEDHHQIDALSSEALTYLLRNAESAPLLVVVTAREAAAEEAIALGGLSPAETSQMARGMLGVEALPAGFGQPLYELTQGLPERVAQVLAHLVRQGALPMADGRFQVPASFPTGRVPADIQALALRQIESCSEPARTLAAFAAVSGEPFTIALAARTLPLDEEALFDAVDELKQARVIDHAGEAYAFTAGEVRRTLYKSLPEPERERLHAAIAAALESELPEEAPPLAALTAVARHAIAGKLPQAVRYAYQAGVANQAIYALDTAQSLLEGGLALLEAETAASWEPLQCDYRLALAEILIGRHELEGAKAHLEAGLALVERLDDPARRLRLWLVRGAFAIESQGQQQLQQGVGIFDEARALAGALGDEGRQVLAGFKMGRCLFFLGQNARALETLEAVLALPFAPAHPYWYSRALAFSGYLQSATGEAGRESGLARLKQAQALQEGLGEKIGLSMTCNMLTDLLTQLGHFAEAEKSAEKEAALVLEIGHVAAYGIALLNRAIACLEMGRFEEAVRHGEAVVGIGGRVSDPVCRCLGALVTGLARIQRGELTAGLAQLEAGQQAAAETAGYIQAVSIPFALEGQILLGRLQAAKFMAQEAQFMLRSCEDPTVQLRMPGLLARIHAGLGEPEIARGFAESHLKDALAAGAKGEIIKALLNKAAIALADGAPAEAERLAEQAHARALTLGAAHLAARARALSGDAALEQGLPEAIGHFREMQALADQVGAPVLRAEALFGQALAVPGDQAANQLILEAQKVLREVASALDEEGRQAFYAPRERRRIREKNPLLQEEMALNLENSQLVMERLNRVSQDLSAVSAQYGAMLSELTTKRRQLEMLNDLANRLNESLDVREVLSLAVKLTLELTKAERGFLLMVGEDGQLACRAAADQFGRDLSGEGFSMSACEKVLASQRALAILDAAQDEEFQASKSIQALHLRTLMAVPLAVKGQRLGVLYVDSQAIVTTFTGRDLELLLAIASHVSVAIENARLYTRLEARAQELERALGLYHQASREANTDMLTGMYNRRWFLDNATRAIDTARRYERPLSVIILDVDHFKQFNDTYGHAIGDEVLKAVGQVMPEAVRNVDLPARLGGEEFVALCPETDAEGAKVVAERIRQAIMTVKLTDTEGAPVRQITASLGVACLAPGDETIAAVLDRADVALYHAKAGGRNQSVIWESGMGAVPPTK